MLLKKIRLLGEGGFGIVDLVTDERGSQFARKTFSINQRLNEQMADNVRKRFIREARIQQGINHKHIVPVIGGDLDATPPYYLMPVAISNLAIDLEADKTLSGNFISAISDIAGGLEELHRLEIFHRDLKPQNVLRFEDADRKYYAVGDFGLISQRDSTLSKLTTTGMAKGSDYYTAPEITADLRKASPQSDIFSLGCILHDMVGKEPRVPCQEIREEGSFGGILLSCTRNDPKRRFKSVRAVVDALLSLDPGGPTIKTAAANAYAEKLDLNESLDEEFYRTLTEFIEDKIGSDDAHALLMKLSLMHIKEVCDAYPDYANRLGTLYAQWVQSSGFAFSSCDGLANRLEIFISVGSLTVKVECLMAMLEMGTSHNRWYVERKFLNLCDPKMEDAVAQRLAIEFRAVGNEICRSIAHLEGSISETRDSFHPILVKTLSVICA